MHATPDAVPISRRFPTANAERTLLRQRGIVVANRDLTIDGIIGDLVVAPGANVVVTGLIEKSLNVERDAVVYVDGLVDGTATVDGALCVDGGHVARSLRGSGIVFDPAEPADSEVR